MDKYGEKLLKEKIEKMKYEDRMEYYSIQGFFNREQIYHAISFCTFYVCAAVFLGFMLLFLTKMVVAFQYNLLIIFKSYLLSTLFSWIAAMFFFILAISCQIKEKKAYNEHSKFREEFIESHTK